MRHPAGVVQVNEMELRQGHVLIPTCGAPRGSEVSSDKLKVECNGDISAPAAVSRNQSYYSDCNLTRKIDTLNAELAQSRQLVADLRQSEQSLRQRSETLLVFSIFISAFYCALCYFHCDVHSRLIGFANRVVDVCEPK